MKYLLYINGVFFEKFKTLKDLDNYLFTYNISYDNPKIYQIEVKKIQ